MLVRLCRPEDGSALRLRVSKEDCALPAVYEEPYGNQNASRNHQRNAKLRPADTTITSLETTVNAIIQRRADLCAQEEAESKRNVVETANADRLIVVLR